MYQAPQGRLTDACREETWHHSSEVKACCLACPLNTPRSPACVLSQGGVITFAMAGNTLGHFFLCARVHFKRDASLHGLVSHSWEVTKYTHTALSAKQMQE